jgi:DNA-binding MarR family transcriptional regulator
MTDALTTNPTESAYRTLITTFGMLKRVMEPFFAHHGISGGQWGVLRVLLRATEERQPALRLMDLSDRLLIRPPSVTGVVDGLERLGLVDRVTDEADQRSKQISLTPAGRKLAKQLRRSHGQRVQTILSGLTVQEQSDLQHLLERVRGQLETMDPAAGATDENEPVAHRNGGGKRRGNGNGRKTEAI